MTVWRVRFTSDFDADFLNVLNHTADTFGARQYDIYKALILKAIRNLEAGPDVRGSASRADIGPGLHTYPISRAGGRGSHFLLYRPASADTIEVLRLLHERMDISRHVPKL